MNKYFLLLASAALIVTACQKETPETVFNPENDRANTTTTGVGPVPSTFTKKTIVEHFVSTTNGDAPMSSWALEQVVRANPNRVYSTELHWNDVMALNQTQRLLTAMGVSALTDPTGCVDRKSFGSQILINSSQFSNAVTANLTKPVDCGLAIRSTTANRAANIFVHSGFTTNFSTPLNLTVYLVEDQVISSKSAFAQKNNMNNVAGTPFTNMGNPINNYLHSQVVRRVLTSAFGNTLSTTTINAGSSIVSGFTVDIPEKINPNSRWKVIAFITDAVTNEILNVQQADLGTIKNWN